MVVQRHSTLNTSAARSPTAKPAAAAAATPPLLGCMATTRAHRSSSRLVLPKSCPSPRLSYLRLQGVSRQLSQRLDFSTSFTTHTCWRGHRCAALVSACRMHASRRSSARALPSTVPHPPPIAVYRPFSFDFQECNLGAKPLGRADAAIAHARTGRRGDARASAQSPLPSEGTNSRRTT